MTITRIEATTSKTLFATCCHTGIGSGVICMSGACQMPSCFTVPKTMSCITGIIFTITSMLSNFTRMLSMTSVSARSIAIITSSISFSFIILATSS